MSGVADEANFTVCDENNDNTPLLKVALSCFQ